MSGFPPLSDKLEKVLKLLVSQLLLKISSCSTISGRWDLTPYYFLLVWQLSDYDDLDMYRAQVINILQDIMEIITQDIMTNGHE